MSCHKIIALACAVGSDALRWNTIILKIKPILRKLIRNMCE